MSPHSNISRLPPASDQLSNAVMVRGFDPSKPLLGQRSGLSRFAPAEAVSSLPAMRCLNFFVFGETPCLTDGYYKIVNTGRTGHIKLGKVLDEISTVTFTDRPYR